MPTTICTSCNKGLKIRDELLGKRVKCPGCGTSFLPTSTSASPVMNYAASVAPRTYSAPPAFSLNPKVVIGLVTFGAGALGTAASYFFASRTGGSYFIFTGLLIGGLVRILTGLATGE